MAKRQKTETDNPEAKHPYAGINRWLSRHSFILRDIAARWEVPMEETERLARETLECLYGVYRRGDSVPAWDALVSYPHGRAAREEIRRIIVADPYAGDRRDWDGWQKQEWTPMIWSQ